MSFLLSTHIMRVEMFVNCTKGTKMSVKYLDSKQESQPTFLRERENTQRAIKEFGFFCLVTECPNGISPPGWQNYEINLTHSHFMVPHCLLPEKLHHPGHAVNSFMIQNLVSS